MNKKNDQGTLHSNVNSSYSEPSICFLTVRAAPFTTSNIYNIIYKSFAKNE